MQSDHKPVEPTAADHETIRRLVAAVNEIPIAHRDETPLPPYGAAPPVPQPGRAPMSAKAVDDAARMLSASVLVAVTGGSGTALLWASGHANPGVIAVVFGAPTALVLALGRLARRARGVLPEQHHHHYAGPVDQRTINNRPAGVWVRNATRNG
ncbi:hypothetical protein [Streptomyces sp. NPDC085596]|uniref:hypothetical protein n=1 Tax=Streptomyces sp. NPDC085596 TaxID=3365731 RepID=UPI0037D4F972